MKIKLLILEDIKVAELMQTCLKHEHLNFTALVVENEEEYTNALLTFLPDIIISDHTLPSFTYQVAINILKNSGKRIPFILVTAAVPEQYVAQSIHEGVYDYVLKDKIDTLPARVIDSIKKCSVESRI